MSKRYTCPQGHEWQAPPGDDALFDLGAIACPVCGKPASTLAPGDVEEPTRPMPPETGDDLPAIAGYEVLEELGRGGMGVVYKAVQIALKRPVALKMIRAGERGRAAELVRFRAEAEMIARLHHPNIVQIYEVGEQGGRPYLALEYVEGGPLSRRLNGTPWPPESAAALIATLAHAVHAAHEKGIVHRDLKPANILLSRSSADATDDTDSKEKGRHPPFLSVSSAASVDRFSPKIADFGLAKRLDDDSGQTRTGEVLGTPSYMAPEQALGLSKDVGPATDVYALGALLYELLTGRPPFRGASVLDTLEQVRSQEPVPPRRLQPKLPRDLETICLKCLQKEPGKRYPSAEGLAEDLRRFGSGESIGGRSARRGRRGAGAVASRWRPACSGRWRSSSPPGWRASWRSGRRADREKETAERNYDHALRAADTLVSGMIDAVRPIAGSQAPTVRQALADAAAVYETLLREGERPAVLAGKAKMLTSFAEVYLDLNDSAKALSAAEEAVALYERLSEAAPDDTDYRAGLTRALAKLGRVRQEQGHLGPARDDFTRAEALARALRERDPERTAFLADLFECRHQEATLFWESSDLEGSRRAAEEALAHAEELARREPNEPRWQRALAIAHEKVGDALYEFYEIDAAVRSYEAAVALQEKLSADSPSAAAPLRDLARVSQQLSGVWHWKGDADRGQKSLQRAREVAERLVQQDPANVQGRRLLLGCRMKLAGHETGGARKQLELCREIEALTRTYAARDPARIRWQSDLASVQLLRGRAHLTLAGEGQAPPDNLEHALEAFRAGLAVVEPLAASNPDNPTLVNQLFVFRYFLGQALAGQKKEKEATQTLLAAWRTKRDLTANLRRLHPNVKRWEDERAESEKALADLEKGR